jgi:DNA mismatch repair protein MutS
MSLIKNYLDLTNKYYEEYGELSIILMQNGAFFEVYGLKDASECVYGSTITEFSRICDLNIVNKKVPGGDNMLVNGDKVVNAGFKTHLIEKYIKKLQDQGYTVLVYEEQGDDPTTKQKIRNLTGVFSPGTYFNPEIEQDQLTNNVCCLWIEIIKQKIYIGVGLIDIFTGKTVLNEYNEDYFKNPITFDELERFVAIYKPSETIIVTNIEQNELNEIIQYIDLKSKSVHVVSLLEEQTNKNNIRAKNCEKQTYQYELLNKFYEIFDMDAFMSTFYENVYATQAFCYLLDFVFQHNPYLIRNLSEPYIENTNTRMILANHSLKQLNIIDDDNYKGKFSSVSKMLNECVTSMGKRKFNHDFLNPTTDEKFLQQEYDITEYILTNNFKNEYMIIKNLLVQIKDISKMMRQIYIQKITPKNIYYLYTSLCITNILYQHIHHNESIVAYLNEKIPTFVSLSEQINDLINYLKDVFLIDECQDIDNISKIDKSFIKNGVDIQLDKNIQTLMESQDKLEACRLYFNTIISNFESKPKTKKTKKVLEDDEDDNLKSYVSIYETDKNNYSLIATDRRCKILEESVKNLNQVKLTYCSSFDSVQTDFILFLELEYNKQSQSKKTISNNQIDELCKNVKQIKTNLIDVVSEVYQRIVKRLQQFDHHIEQCVQFITYIDVIYTKAFIAEKYNYCKPNILSGSNKSMVNVTELRHCLIEKIQQNELYVSNNIELGSLMDGMLLYGTNAVGKTSFIRALGISVIMAQAGLYVPATVYEYKPYKHIFTRILGNDNIFKGLSTFAVEMSELRTILKQANENSLVLGDELCSGTESISAISIFVAGIQKLAYLGCSFIFATHLHEIIHYHEIESLSKVCIKHMSVKYDIEKDCLVYNRTLQDGPGNSMYGLEVCKSLHLPRDFLEAAHNIRMKYHPETAGILENKSSHYNSKHISGGLCEKCNKKMAVDVHHLIYQNEANEKGIIHSNELHFNKNVKANLLNVCQDCHDQIHKSDTKYKKTKTTKGYVLTSLS